MKNYINNKIIKLIPISIILLFKRVLQGKREYYFIQNINIDPEIVCQKRVLISYVTQSLTTDSSNWNTSTRATECSLIIKFFIDDGYIVDVVECNDKSKLPIIFKKTYDVIFGFGDVFYNISKRQINANRILYLTEKPPYFSYKKEKERIDYFYQRHCKKVPFGRSGQYYKEEHFEKIDSLIFVGTEIEKSILNVKVPCYPIAVTGLKNNLFQISRRNVNKAKKNFLWLGSMGAIHKGLDLLIDVFEKQNTCILHIAGLNALDRSMLQSYKNKACIRDHGFLSAQSSEFCMLMEQCGFLIFPSCSEALSTGVITSMNHGLIPIITRETGFELPNIGAYIEDFTVSSIYKIVKEYSTKSDEWMKEQQLKTLEYSTKNFNIFKYKKRISEILEELL